MVAVATTGFVDTIDTCDPGDSIYCKVCGKTSWFNWGLEPPDHLSNLKDAQQCQHHICVYCFSGQAKKQQEENLKAALRYCGRK